MSKKKGDYISEYKRIIHDYVTPNVKGRKFDQASFDKFIESTEVSKMPIKLAAGLKNYMIVNEPQLFETVAPEEVSRAFSHNLRRSAALDLSRAEHKKEGTRSASKELKNITRLSVREAIGLLTPVQLDSVRELKYTVRDIHVSEKETSAGPAGLRVRYRTIVDGKLKDKTYEINAFVKKFLGG